MIPRSVTARRRARARGPPAPAPPSDSDDSECALEPPPDADSIMRTTDTVHGIAGNPTGNRGCYSPSGAGRAPNARYRARPRASTPRAHARGAARRRDRLRCQGPSRCGGPAARSPRPPAPSSKSALSRGACASACARARARACAGMATLQRARALLRPTVGLQLAIVTHDNEASLCGQRSAPRSRPAATGSRGRRGRRDSKRAQGGPLPMAPSRATCVFFRVPSVVSFFSYCSNRRCLCARLFRSRSAGVLTERCSRGRVGGSRACVHRKHTNKTYTHTCTHAHEHTITSANPLVSKT